MKRHRVTLKCLLPKSQYERLHVIGFQLHDILEKRKL